jgi:cytochrome c oxidase cbb3-type subunit 3
VVLYDQNCLGCHGNDTHPGASVALADPVYLALADDAWIARVTVEGLPGTAMPAFGRTAGGNLSDEQVKLLVSGMRSRWGKPDALAGVTPPPLAAPPGDPAAGAAAYLTFCARCHATDGTGGPHGGSVVDGSYLGLTSDRLLRTIVLVGRPHLGMPDWRSMALGRPMSDAEVADVVAWLAARRPVHPGEPYPTEAQADG